jgi:fatty acid desaturase
MAMSIEGKTSGVRLMKPNSRELQQLFCEFNKNEARVTLSMLQNIDTLQSFLAFAADWVMICLSMVLMTWGWIWGVLGIAILGSRQRALSNLVHDASHRNLFSSKRVNDFAANFLAAYPMLDTVSAYREGHLKHHRHLGERHNDPDYENHIRYGFDDKNPPKGMALSTFLKLALNFRAWQDSLFGNFSQLSAKEKRGIIVWWLVTEVTLIVFGGWNIAALFFAAWYVARASSYHLVRLFAEFLDHTGLESSTTLRFTRNLPHNGFWAMFFHPHQDTYHLVHHIFVKVPHYNLKMAHDYLMKSSTYKSAHHCDSYFQGEHSAVSCWQGTCGANE